MVEAINSWIKSGCDYPAGVALYEQLGPSNFLKGIFKKGETAHNRQKLNAELTALRDAAPAQVPPVPPVAKVLITPNSGELKNASQASPKSSPKERTSETQVTAIPELISIRNQLDQTYQEIRSLHPYLSITPEGEDLRLISERIVRLGKKNAELWHQYNYLLENGAAPVPEPAPPVMIDKNLLDKRELLRKSLNKAENRIKGDPKPKLKTLKLIENRRRELKELDEQIAAIKNGGKS